MGSRLLRRSVVVVLTGGLMMLTQRPAQGEYPYANRVTNGNFVEGTEGWHLPKTGVERGMSREEGPDGTWLCLTRAVSEAEHNVVSDPFAVEAGARYGLRARVKLVQGSALRYKVTVEWLDDEGKHLGYANDWTGHVRGPEWQDHDKQLTAPEGARQARILLGIAPGGALRMTGIRFQLLPPKLVIEALGMAEPVWRAGEVNELRCRIRNAGGLPIEDLNGTLTCGDWAFPVRLGVLDVGEERLLSAADPAHPWPLGRAFIGAAFTAANADARSADGVVFLLPDGPTSTRSLSSGDATIRFLAGNSFSGCAEVTYQGKTLGIIRGIADVKIVGDVPRFGATRTAANGVRKRPKQMEWAWRNAAYGVETSLTATDGGCFELTATVTAVTPITVTNFSLLDLFVNFDGAGTAKDSALFGGLEYLTAKDMSSGTESVVRDLADRYVPHPNKVTTPVMAVAKDGVAIGLLWNPLQEWTKGQDRPAAIFASPDRIHLSDGHFMSIAAPGVGRYREENARVSMGFRLDAGETITLKGRLFVLPVDRDVSEVVPEIHRKYLGTIPLPDVERDYGKHWRDAIDYSMFTWDETVKGWKSEAHHKAMYHERIAAQLLNYAVWHDDPVADKARRQVGQAIAERIAKHGAGSIDLDVALHTGHVAENLGGLWGGLDLINSQRPDGSWAFTPDEKTASLGKAGDTASGICLKAIVSLLELAERSGSRRALDAALKGLDYVDKTFNRPAGGETWEVPLHAPNLRAAALGVDAGVLAYRMTGEEKYLGMARYWADTGLPFLYTWEAKDRPGMRYATVSVFGATFHTTIWFGRPVQWVGIMYARSLNRLATVDPDKALFWKHTAEGILLSAIQQQRLSLAPEAGNPWPGAIPDSYELTQGVVMGAWIGPQLILPSLETANEAPGLDTALVGKPGRQIRIWSAARIKDVVLERGRLRADFAYPAGRSAHALLLCATRPETVSVDGKTLTETQALDQADSGWHYNEARHVVIIKHRGGDVRRLRVGPLDFARSLE